MPGKAYTMREMKLIVEYLTEHRLYNELKGRKMWVDFANSKLTDRTWQSLKETFLKRILPDIHNPYYKLSIQEICSFRQGYDVEVKNKSRLEIQTVSDGSNSAGESKTDNEQPCTSKNNEEKTTSGEDIICTKIQQRNRSSTDTLVLEQCYETAEEIQKDLESDDGNGNARRTLRDLITYSEPLTPMLQEVLDDFATDEDEPRMQIVENPEEMPDTTKEQPVKRKSNSPIGIRESPSLNLKKSMDTSKTSEENKTDEQSDDPNKSSNASKITLKLIKTQEGAWENKDAGSADDSLTHDEKDALKQNEKSSTVASGNTKDNVNVDPEATNIDENVPVTGKAKKSTENCSNSTTDTLLPNNQEGLVYATEKRISNESSTSDFQTETKKGSKKKLSRKRSSSQVATEPKRKLRKDKKLPTIACVEEKGDDAVASKDTHKENSVIDLVTPEFNSNNEIAKVDLVTQEIDTLEPAQQVTDNAKSSDITEITVNQNKSNEHNSQEAGPSVVKNIAEINPCLQSVNLFAEQFNTSKYSDSDSDFEVTTLDVGKGTAEEKSKVVADVHAKPKEIVKSTEKNKEHTPTTNGNARNLKVDKYDNRKNEKDMVLLESHSETDSDSFEAPQTKKHNVHMSKTQRDKALANVFGFTSGGTTNKRRRLSSRDSRSGRPYRRSRKDSRRSNNTMRDESESSEYSTLSESDDRSPPRRKHRHTKKYVKPKTYNIMSHPRDGGLFILNDNQVCSLVRSKNRKLQYVSGWHKSDSEETNDSYWQKKYFEEKLRTNELKRSLEQAQIERKRAGSPILQLKPALNADINHQGPSDQSVTKQPPIPLNNAENLPKDKEEVTKEEVKPVVKEDVTAKLKFTNSDGLIEVECPVPHLDMMLNKIVQLFDKSSKAKAIAKPVAKPSAKPPSPAVLVDSDLSTPVTPIDPEVHEVVTKLEEQIFKKIEDLDKSQIEPTPPESNVTKRRRGRPRKVSRSSSSISVQNTTPTETAKKSEVTKQSDSKKSVTSNDEDAQTTTQTKAETPGDNVKDDIAVKDATEDNKSVFNEVQSDTGSTTSKRRTRAPKKFADETIYYDTPKSLKARNLSNSRKSISKSRSISNTRRLKSKSRSRSKLSAPQLRSKSRSSPNTNTRRLSSTRSKSCTQILRRKSSGSKSSVQKFKNKITPNSNRRRLRSMTRARSKSYTRVLRSISRGRPKSYTRVLRSKSRSKSKSSARKFRSLSRPNSNTRRLRSNTRAESNSYTRALRKSRSRSKSYARKVKNKIRARRNSNTRRLRSMTRTKSYTRILRSTSRGRPKSYTRVLRSKSRSRSKSSGRKLKTGPTRNSNTRVLRSMSKGRRKSEARILKSRTRSRSKSSTQQLRRSRSYTRKLRSKSYLEKMRSRSNSTAQRSIDKEPTSAQIGRITRKSPSKSFESKRTSYTNPPIPHKNGEEPMTVDGPWLNDVQSGAPSVLDRTVNKAHDNTLNPPAASVRARSKSRSLSTRKDEVVIPEDDSQVRYMLPAPAPEPRSSSRGRLLRANAEQKAGSSYVTTKIMTSPDDLSRNSIESSQGYQDSDASPALIRVKRRRKLSVTAVYKGRQLRNKIKRRSYPYLADDDSWDGQPSLNRPASTTNIPNSSLNTEVYRSESYQLLLPKHTTMKQLDDIYETSDLQIDLNQGDSRTYDIISPLSVEVDNQRVVLTEVNKSGSPKTEGNSSNVSLPLSPELSVVENISITKDMLSSTDDHPTINETQCNDVIERDTDYDKYLISAVDVSHPLMQQNCQLHETAGKEVEDSGMAHKDGEAQSFTDSLDMQLRNLLLESAKKIQNAQRSNNDGSAMEVDATMPPVQKNSKPKKRCSTPRKKTDLRKSKAPVIDPVLEEHTESCSRGSRKSYPPMSKDDENSDTNVKATSVNRKRQKKDVIKVKITKPRNKSLPKEARKRDKRTHSASKLSLCTDSGINDTESGVFLGCNDSVELIHNHSETCLQANECIGDDDSVEFIESKSTSIICVDSASKKSDGQCSCHTDCTHEEFPMLELFCSNAQEATNLVNPEQEINSAPAVTDFISPRSNNSFNSILTEDLSDEAPSQTQPMPSKWSLLSEDETNTAQFLDATSQDYNGVGASLKDIFPITCSIPNLSTITEYTENDSRKFSLLDTDAGSTQNEFIGSQSIFDI